MSTSGQPQFRYTQTPSKVLHLRNLPWECNEEELVELGKPFGKIVNTKCNADLNQAINMVTYYASSSEPASVRGKTVYIQYSNRHEIVNNKGPGDVAGNVLLVTIEGVEAGDVFSAFGFVHKIATFEKAAGFQALIQFSDAETAASAKEALDGRSIPRHAISFNYILTKRRGKGIRGPVYAIQALAVSSTDDILTGHDIQPIVGADGKKVESESNVLLASIENMQYAVTVDVLHMVFSAYGTVQKIAIFEKNGGTQALIQYPDVATAAASKDALEGHCIYDGGYCKLHLSYSRHTDLNVKAFSEKSRDYTVVEGLLGMPQPSGPAAAAPVWHNPQAAAPGSGFIAGSSVQAQAPGQVPSWDPQMQAGRTSFVSVPSTFPGQTYGQPPLPAYATSATPPGSSPLGHSSPMSPSVHAMRGAPPAHQPNMRPGGALPLDQPPYYR
ncbi:hypothetical protein RJ639_014101 [Escallonia herrerae]|uniref:RRM domain-containing protein n=1 Tax=Escallonia herrerae TaxID=1293975 RepID=A0AA88VFB5_9ASTE|nr:hypothetical protein RJ639_014101 [Escallonia herrerae]